MGKPKPRSKPTAPAPSTLTRPQNTVSPPVTPLTQCKGKVNALVIELLSDRESTHRRKGKYVKNGTKASLMKAKERFVSKVNTTPWRHQGGFPELHLEGKKTGFWRFVSNLSPPTPKTPFFFRASVHLLYPHVYRMRTHPTFASST
jgi:hypothetical protein